MVTAQDLVLAISNSGESAELTAILPVLHRLGLHLVSWTRRGYDTRDADAHRVLARLARYPWGPWGEPATLLACAKAEYCYGAKEQPGFAAEDGGKIFITLEKKNAPYLYELAFEGEDHGGL